MNQQGISFKHVGGTLVLQTTYTNLPEDLVQLKQF